MSEETSKKRLTIKAKQNWRKNDEYYTPAYAVKPLIKYLINKNYHTIWESAALKDKKSEITQELEKVGMNVIETTIHRGQDFLNYEPEFDFDIIITNPPYSLKTPFLKRAYQLNKPFALLLPLTALEGIERNKLYRKHGLELLIFDKRVDFKKDSSGVWFATAWFCHNLLPEKLVFEKLIKKR